MRKDVDVYKSCDRAIKAMDRENVEAFGQLKLSNWDEVNIIRTVVKVYRESARKARKRYRKVAYDAYLLGLELCLIDGRKAEKMAQEAITMAWVKDVLAQTDFVTLYRFDTETERKAYRLAETLEVVPDRDREIDKALRYWSRQLAQYAINMTDYAMLQAYQDVGIEQVEWVTQRDEKVCSECMPRDGRKYKIDEVPSKHMNCRCYMIPVI